MKWTYGWKDEREDMLLSLQYLYDLFNNEKEDGKHKFVSHESDWLEVGYQENSRKCVWISMTNWSIKTRILIASRNGTEFQKENITPKEYLPVIRTGVTLCPNKGNYPIGFCFIKQLVFIRMWVFMSIFICSFFLRIKFSNIKEYKGSLIKS